MDASIETNTYTTPAPTLLDPDGVKSLEEAREAIKVYNQLQLDLHRALVQREQVINSMAAAIAPVVLAYVKRDAAGATAALHAYVENHVNVYGPGVKSSATH